MTVRVLRLVAWVFLAAADGGTSAATVNGPVRTAQEAEARFRRAFDREISPTLTSEDRALAERRLATRPSVHRQSCRVLRTQLVETLGPAASETLLRGTAQQLDRAGSCWQLHWDGQLESGLSAVIEAAQGRVLALWFTPEG
jgi:hypothetical protein